LRIPINGTPLPNYDTDRNTSPGLTVIRSSEGLTSTDSRAVQRWRLTMTSALPVTSARLEMWFSRSDANTADTIMVAAAGLYDCAADGTDCVELSETFLPYSAVSGTFGGLAFDLHPSTAHTIPVGRALELRVATLDGSAADALVAYDSLEFPATLDLG
jgi:hypothetical protein